MLMHVSEYINDTARAETRIHYIIYKMPSDDDQNPRILSFIYVNHLMYNLTDKKIFADMFDATIINTVEIEDTDLQVASISYNETKIILLITR